MAKHWKRVCDFTDNLSDQDEVSYEQGKMYDCHTSTLF